MIKLFTKKKEQELYNKLDRTKLPQHIAIIMDGNGRWARKKNLPRIMGHRAGVKSVRVTVRACGELGIKVLTLYVFSTENWRRPADEVNALMSLLSMALKNETPELIKNNVQLRVIGRQDALPVNVRNTLAECIQTTAHGTGLILNLALNYGGRQEIVDAVNALIASGNATISEEKISRFLYTKDLPDPDILIRTANEKRLSNFLLWQLAYAEFIFTPVLWPSFRKENLIEAIIEYQKRERRFGGI